jgi:hypothetical protein
MMITKKHLQRRTFLRGLGTTLALPFLDAMVPAFAAPRCQAGSAPGLFVRAERYHLRRLDAEGRRLRLRV